MRQGAIILAVGGLELALVVLLPIPGRLFFAWIAATTTTVGLACLLGATGLLGKTADGRVPWWSLALFWPWHAFVRAVAALVRARETPFTEVHPGWHVGGWPHAHGLGAWPAVVDLTCELPRRHPCGAYLCLPTWDGTAPRPDQIDAGVRFAAEHRRAGRPVLFHCAAGHGRSVCVLVAALVDCGLHPTWEEAFAHVRRARPTARLVSEQREALRRWASSRG